MLAMGRGRCCTRRNRRVGSAQRAHRGAQTTRHFRNTWAQRLALLPTLRLPRPGHEKVWEDRT
jgi:hypothetical protein